MAFTFVRTTDGSLPTTISLPANGCSIQEGDLVYIDATGYVSNETAGSCYTHNVVGVAEAAVSAGSAQAVPIQNNHNAIYRVDTTAAAAQTDVGTCVGLDTARVISESTARVDKRGVVRIVKYITNSTSQSLEVMINFAEPGGA